MAAIPRSLHPNHGVHDQSARIPPRVPNSVRRTTTIDTFRFDGPAGASTVVCRGRDLHTTDSGDAVVLDAVTCELVLEPLFGDVRSAADVSGGADLSSLVGSNVSHGFRKLLNPLTPVTERGSLRHRLLDDLPGAILVSAHPVVGAGVYPLKPRELLVLTDVCRGWADGGGQHDDIAQDMIPTPTGPTPSDLTDRTDPLAMHDTGPVTHDFMRRGRRIDVRALGDEIEIDVHFRDVWVPLDGEGEVIHEYSVTGRADASSLELRSVTARAHALPWTECNPVTESAQLAVGARLGELETVVRTRMSGTVGCTHLNDTMRGLDAVPTLVKALQQEFA